MASTHKSLRSSTANKRPTTSIADGQIALNTNAASPGLYFKDSTGASIIKIGPVHVGTTAPNVAPAGSSGNSNGETWLDTSLTPNGWKVWTGAAWVNATPVGSATVQGLLELATDAETQAGSDTARAVTPAGLQSKVSDSTSTTSSTTIASSTAVKSAYDLANAALPKSGGTVTGNLEIGTSGSLTFEGATADAFETTIAVVDPTADRTITFPDTTGTVVTTGDTGTVTSAMIANGTIVDADVNASAAIALSKLATGALPTAITVASANIVDGSILNADVNASAAIAGTKISPDFGSQNAVTTGTSTAASFIPTSSSVPTNGVYLPSANNVAISTNGTGRLFVDDSGRLGIGTTTPSNTLTIVSPNFVTVNSLSTQTSNYLQLTNDSNGIPRAASIFSSGDALCFGTNSNAIERGRFDSSGRLLVGTSTSPSAGALTQYANFVARGNTGGSGFAGVITVGRGEAATSITSGEEIGYLTFSDLTGNECATIQCAADANAGAGDYPGRLVFSTTAYGASSPTERMRITSLGVFKASNTGSYLSSGSSVHEIRNNTDNNNVLIISSNASNGTQYGLSIRTTNDQNDTTRDFLECLGGGVLRAQIRTNGGLANFSANNANLSDRNVKKDISLAANTWGYLKQWEIVSYRYKDQPDDADLNLGVIAQQVAKSCPEVITIFQEAKEATETEPAKEERLGVKEQQMYWMAIKALQEAQARIEALEADVAQLKGA